MTFPGSYGSVFFEMILAAFGLRSIVGRDLETVVVYYAISGP
jgi:hypothetical protein